MIEVDTLPDVDSIPTRVDPPQPFQQITDLTDVPEGTIVRVITRLDETCREVRDAARVIGDAELFQKMEEAQALIKRDSEWHRDLELSESESDHGASS